MAEMIKTPRIGNTEVIAPYYPDNQDCVYCTGDYPVDPTRFDVILNNGIKIERVCSICLYEIFLESPKYIKQIIRRCD